ncbi:DNA fragmentation factor subunit beta isoform X2 [Varanus komodoensis]|uniref:DNA fragmentation factor subunit beta isoform X2 n=1 Tax=Varanus komodoensis TaxID=61221 RepID=UPI001CF7C788|nr:DNA fragmentation factor subunit beta isoform X2 [Varanus komodoensis]
MGSSLAGGAMAPKGFKIRRPSAGRKYGVAARGLRELLSKACLLLQLPLPGSRLCLYEDGTEVTEDYFQKIPENSELVLLAPGEDWHGYVSEIQRFLHAFSTQADAVIQAARGLLSSEEAPGRQKLLADLIQNLSENISAETRDEDESWFEGVESRFKTKSSYMRYSCESRIRAYVQEVSSYASAIHPPVQAKFKQIVQTMLEKLKLERYNGCYFDRSESKKVCLCTPEGWFSCQGPFDAAGCQGRHSINPYGNKESRILFSTWNLDHIIEKKRMVLPTLAKAIEGCEGREVDWEYFYRLLFTVENLKLVHVACHKKGTHNLSCDKKRIYRKQKQARRIRK